MLTEPLTLPHPRFSRKSLKEKGHAGRLRFTIAHEIGHWILHRSLCEAVALTLNLFEACPQGERMVSLNRNVFPEPGQSIPPEEWQANTFAAHLLIPAEELRTEFTRRFGSPVATRTAGIDRSEHARALAKAISSEVSQPLYLAFGVSIQAMGIALESRGYVREQAALV